MGVKSDHWIRKMADKHGLIDPFEGGQIRFSRHNTPIITYGTTSYGYDFRCANVFKVFTNIRTTLIDPKNVQADSYVDVEDDVCIIPPHSMALAKSVERFRFPSHIMGQVSPKTTYSRCGLALLGSNIDPGWHGHLTLSLFNTTPLPLKVYAQEGLGQMVFIEPEEKCSADYEDRRGKYQGVKHITLPKF